MNFWLFAPEFALTGAAFAVLGVDLVLPRERKGYLPALSLVGLAGVLVLSLWYLWGKNDQLYDGLFLIDNYSLFFKGFFLVLGMLVVLVSVEYVRQHLSRPGEYYGILLFSVLAMMLMAASGELLTAYISLELLSFSLYVLVSYGRHGLKPSEASVKYILLGAFASALLLYGISQVYGILGTTRFDEIHAALALADAPLNPAVLVGLALIIAGLGFKVAAVPFHMWAPDVYEGAPTPVTAYLAVGSKAAAFALILRLFTQAFMPAFDDWQIVLVVLAALTMTLGNLVALAQTNIKRMLAYSSVGQVGYLLMGCGNIAAGVQRGDTAPCRVRDHQPGRLPVHHRLLQRHGQGERTGLRRAGATLAIRGHGADRGAVLAGGTAFLRGVHHQVLPVHGGGAGRAAVAGCAGDHQQRHIALLLHDDN